MWKGAPLSNTVFGTISIVIWPLWNKKSVAHLCCCFKRANFANLHYSRLGGAILASLDLTLALHSKVVRYDTQKRTRNIAAWHLLVPDKVKQCN